MSKSETLLHEEIVSLGDDFPQLSFALNNPGVPNTVYTGADPKPNAGLQFQITTSTKTTLTPGAPVPIEQAPNVSYSLLYLDLTPFDLSDAEFTNIVVSTDGGWAALADLATRTICFAPGKPIPITAGPQGVSVAITGFAMANPPSGSTVQLNATYYNVDGITIDNFPSSTPLEVALLRPPDQNDNDLHDDISLTVQPTLVVCSKDPYTPVPNTLTIQFSPGPQGHPVTAGKETVFEVHFLYAETPGFGALCTADQGDCFHPARGTNAQQWDEPLVIKTQEPYVSLKPPAGAVMVGSGVEAVVTFDIGNIITNLQPGPTLIVVTYSGIPNYQDGSFQFVLTKVPHVDITSLEVTPNPAQLEKEEGVAVVIDWVTHDAGALTLTSSGGLGQDVTGMTSFPTTIKQTTDFKLHADGIWGANLDNKATKSKTAVVIPHIEFSATILPDRSAVLLTWNVFGADSVEIDGVHGQQKLKDTVPLPGPTPANPLPFSFTLRASIEGNEVGTASIKRIWTAGPSISLGGNAIVNHTNSTGIAVSPDGKQLCAPAGNYNNFSVAVFDAASLKPLTSIPMNPFLPLGFAFSPDSSQLSQLYVLNVNPVGYQTSVAIINAKSYELIATVVLPDFGVGFYEPQAIAANDKYIFIKTNGAVQLVILEAQTRKVVWSDTVPNPQTSISVSLALTEKRLHYTGNNVIKIFDCQTLALLKTASVPLSEVWGVQLFAAQDDSRTFLVQSNGVWTFPGSDWLNPTPLPQWQNYGYNRCKGIGVTSDCRQVFLLCSGIAGVEDSYVQIDEFDFGSASYVSGAGLLQGAGIPCAIAVTPDDTRVFVGFVDASKSNAFISVLDASYACEA